MILNLGCGFDPNGDIRLDCRRNSTANVIADACHLPFRPRVFDAIMAYDVLEHLPTTPHESLRNLGVVLKFGGLIYAKTPDTLLNGQLLELAYQLIWFFRLRTRADITHWKKAIVNTLHYTQRHHGWQQGFGGHRWLIRWGRLVKYFFIPYKWIWIVRKIPMLDGYKLRLDDGKGNGPGWYF